MPKTGKVQTKRDVNRRLGGLGLIEGHDRQPETLVHRLCINSFGNMIVDAIDSQNKRRTSVWQREHMCTPGYQAASEVPQNLGERNMRKIRAVAMTKDAIYAFSQATQHLDRTIDGLESKMTGVTQGWLKPRRVHVAIQRAGIAKDARRACQPDEEQGSDGGRESAAWNPWAVERRKGSRTSGERNRRRGPSRLTPINVVMGKFERADRLLVDGR
uniref:Uncharacterized protein n=1 Tax=Coccidioides posadasii RMSCC 3488 TaxID=454284 RepID=A0A0J6IIN5_COCPO|nr:hypothetical protein CPAG_08023 [Coccidioides posadasii RMSCC 3488]